MRRILLILLAISTLLAICYAAFWFYQTETTEDYVEQRLSSPIYGKISTVLEIH